MLFMRLKWYKIFFLFLCAVIMHNFVFCVDGLNNVFSLVLECSTIFILKRSFVGLLLGNGAGHCVRSSARCSRCAGWWWRKRRIRSQITRCAFNSRGRQQVFR